MASLELPAPERLVAGLLAAAADYDFEGCDQQFADALAGLDALVLVRDVAAPALREAGNRWHRGEWTVAQEHLLSGVLRRHLSAHLHDHLERADGPAILFTTLSGERHELGCLMGAFLAASRGYRTLYPGPDLPAGDICRICARRPVQALALSIVTQPEVNDARGQLAELRAGLAPGVEIWLAGQASALLAREQLPAGVVTIGDLPAFLDRLAGLKARHP